MHGAHVSAVHPLEKPAHLLYAGIKEGSPTVTSSRLARNHTLTAEQMHQMAFDNMRAHFVLLHRAGRTRARSPEEFYGFRPDDVSESHLHKQGFGRGVRFRLRDGRVIDVYGKASHPERYWYVSSAH
jgi:hypothetical protein